MQSVARLLAFTAVFGVATAATAEQELPIYPGAVHTRIGSDLVILGEHYRLAYFTTKDSIETVARYFNWHWKRRGIPTLLEGNFKEEGVVSAFYTREGLQRMVVLRIHQGKTVGFVALRDLWVRAPRASDIPSPEGALYASEIYDREDPDNWTRSMLVEGSLETARASAEHLLTAEGFDKQSEQTVAGPSAGRRIIVEHRRGPVEVVTTYVDVEGMLTAVQQSRRGARANPNARSRPAPESPQQPAKKDKKNAKVAPSGDGAGP